MKDDKRIERLERELAEQAKRIEEMQKDIQELLKDLDSRAAVFQGE